MPPLTGRKKLPRSGKFTPRRRISLRRKFTAKQIHALPLPYRLAAYFSKRNRKMPERYRKDATAEKRGEEKTGETKTVRIC